MLTLNGKTYTCNNNVESIEAAYKQLKHTNPNRIPVIDKQNKIVYIVDKDYTDDNDYILDWPDALLFLQTALTQQDGWRCIKS